MILSKNPMFDIKKKIHFIGIGGIGMSALASILSDKGFKVSGSDSSENYITKKLKKKKITVHHGHSKSNLKNIDIVVHSSAIKKNNIELKFAKKNKIPIFSRAMMLADVMKLKSSITVSGSHGKTTTTSLIASILERSNYDPTIINGGIINGLDLNAKLGKGQWLVAEADESDGSFVFLPSTIGIINNIDLEHTDYYSDLNHLKKAFIKYAKNIPFYGLLFLCIDDKNIVDIKQKLSSQKIISYGLNTSANFSATNLKIFIKQNNFFTSFDLIENLKKKKIIKNFTLPLVGKHNVQNCLAAISLSRSLNISYTKIKKSISQFQGVKRRFSILSNKNGNLIIDDYAHHPSEIKATLESLKLISKKNIITIIEPHRFSRLTSFLPDFIKSLSESNSIFVLPVYSAGEKLKSKINSLSFCKLLEKKFKRKYVYLVTNEKKFFKNLEKEITPGDNIIFLGAGRSTIIAEKFCKYLGVIK